MTAPTLLLLPMLLSYAKGAPSPSVVHSGPGLTLTCVVSDLKAKKTWYADGRPYPQFVDFGLSGMVKNLHKYTPSLGTTAVIVLVQEKSPFPIETRLEGLPSSNAAVQGYGGYGTSFYASYLPPASTRSRQDFRFGYSGGAWSVKATYVQGRSGLKLGGWVTDLQQNSFGSTQNEAFVDVHTNFPPSVDPKSVRVLAIDRAGHTFYSNNPFKGTYRLGPELSFPDQMDRLGLRVGSIAKLIVQQRDFHWVVFRQVHLRR